MLKCCSNWCCLFWVAFLLGSFASFVGFIVGWRQGVLLPLEVQRIMSVEATSDLEWYRDHLKRNRTTMWIVPHRKELFE